MNDSVKVLIVDDHQMLIDGVKALLADQNKFQIVAESTNGKDALSILRSQHARNEWCGVGTGSENQLSGIKNTCPLHA